MNTLDPHRRGNTFSFSVPLAEPEDEDGLDWDDFTGGVFFTLREDVPGSDVDDDVDAVDQASSIAGEITFDPDTRLITVTFSATRTHRWPPKRLFWDLEVRIAGDELVVYTLDAGEIRVLPDFTRSGVVDS